MSESSPLPEWYRDWFGEEYLALYPHRDEEEARAAVALVLSAFEPPRGPILDLASGAGRHMLELERRGLKAIGLDLSATLLARARAIGLGLPLVRGDMRQLPFADGSFELVVNFFTSFGYFEDASDDIGVLGEIRRVLRDDGHFALDFLNAERVRNDLVARDERRLGERRVVQERRLEEAGKVVVKEIRVFTSDPDRPAGTYLERVRLYTPGELKEMLRGAGLETEHGYGDYSGAPFQPASPRCILLGRVA